MKELTNKQNRAIVNKVADAWGTKHGLTTILNWINNNTTKERDPMTDWRDQKPMHTIKLFSNGRWQMIG